MTPLAELGCLEATSFDGALALTIDGKTVQVSAETSVVVPPGVVHAIANRSEAPARLLGMYAPDCGFVDYLRAQARGERIEPTASDVWEHG